MEFGDAEWLDDPDLGRLGPPSSNGDGTKSRAGRQPIALVKYADMAARLTGRPLVRGILEREQVSVVYGEAGCGKTFLALDVGLHIAAGLDWLGRRVAQGPVVYIAAEAPGGIVNRAATWRQASGIADLPFAAITSPVDLCHPEAGDARPQARRAVERLPALVRAGRCSAAGVAGADSVMHPGIPQGEIDEAYTLDSEAAAAEFGAEFRSDISGFLDRELVEAAVDRGVVVRPPQPEIAYQAFTDPSGGRGDSFTCAIAHDEGEAAILDCLFERRAPFDPSTVVHDIAELLRSCRISDVEGDMYAAEWVVSAFGKEGIAHRASERDRSAIYLDALPLFTSGRVRLIDNARLIHQFAGLERRTSRVGRDLVDHPPGGSDDAANAAAGAVVLVAGSGGAPASNRGIWQLYRAQAEARGFVSRPGSQVPLPLLQRGIAQ
jgi:hypothetical protein